MVRETQTHAFFFFFFLNHAFIVSRYKKLPAALAMEKTKPINQNKTQKKPPYLVHHYVGALANHLPKPLRTSTNNRIKVKTTKQSSCHNYKIK